MIQGLLRPYQVEIHAAASGREALEKLTQVWPDLILMDHMMPDPTTRWGRRTQKSLPSW